MREAIDGDANPIDALNNDEDVWVCLCQDGVACMVCSQVPIMIVVKTPIRVVQNVTANLG
jgi:hypothetical protein